MARARFKPGYMQLILFVFGPQPAGAHGPFHGSVPRVGCSLPKATLRERERGGEGERERGRGGKTGTMAMQAVVGGLIGLLSTTLNPFD